MSVKVTHKETFDIIHSALNKCANLVKLTFGPESQKVLIKLPTHTMVVDDGVQVMRDIQLEDPNENAVKDIIKEVSIRTNDRVGDGTTGAIIMLQGIINAVHDRGNVSCREISQEIKTAAESAKTQLLAMAEPITTKAQLYKVARIAFDNHDIAELISSAWHKMGIDGIVSVERSGTMETTLDMAEGLKIPNGIISPYMVNNVQRMTAEIDDPLVLVTSYRLTEIDDILPLMEKLSENGIRKLVIVCDNIEGDALATINANGLHGQCDPSKKMHIVAVTAPFKGSERTNFLEDIGLLLGAKVFTEGKGNRLQNVEIDDLGHADRVVATQEEMIFVSPTGDKKAIRAATKSLKTAIEAEKKEVKKDALRQRLARFTNKIAVLKVGAKTDIETIALKYKVEDAIHATHAAFKSGVVAGGGFGLAALTTDSDIFNEALQRPRIQLFQNSGIKQTPYPTGGYAYNVVTGKDGDAMAVGVIDPVDVLIAQVETAASVAEILLTTRGLIVEHPDKE